MLMNIHERKLGGCDVTVDIMMFCWLSDYKFMCRFFPCILKSNSQWTIQTFTYKYIMAIMIPAITM